MSTPTEDKGSFVATTISISLTVKELQKSVDWYHQTVGFSIESRREREGKLVSVVVSAGPVRIALNQDDGAKGWDRIKGLGFSFNIRTEQDIDELAKKVQVHGGTLAMEPTDMPWGARAIRLIDPDGYKITLSKLIVK